MNTPGVIIEATQHIDAFCKLAKSGIVTWKETKVPGTMAMRSYEGRTQEYVCLVVQANTQEHGIIHRAMLTNMAGPLLVVIPPAVAEILYDMAAAGRN